MNQLKHQQNQEKPSYDAKQIAALLQRIFQNIESMDKSQLKALYLTVIDRIDIRKDENHKKQFYVTLKLNNEIIKQLFNDTHSTKCSSALRLYYLKHSTFKSNIYVLSFRHSITPI